MRARNVPNLVKEEHVIDELRHRVHLLLVVEPSFRDVHPSHHGKVADITGYELLRAWIPRVDIPKA